MASYSYVLCKIKSWNYIFSHIYPPMVIMVEYSSYCYGITVLNQTETEHICRHACILLLIKLVVPSTNNRLFRLPRVC
jgi:hypothetical protein